MSQMNENPIQDPLAYIEDFRASATAFSQLTGVLGGFSMTILVLVLDSSLLESHKSARDWIAGLLLLAAAIYICASGLLANSMNVGAFRFVAMRHGGSPKGIFRAQQRAFNVGIGLFHAGNVLLSSGMVVTVYQASLPVGSVASVAIFLTAALVVSVNIHVFRPRLRWPRLGRVHNSTTADERVG